SRSLTRSSMRRRTVPSRPPNPCTCATSAGTRPVRLPGWPCTKGLGMARVSSTLEQKQKVWPRVVEAMNSTGAVWWLADGTALGAFRSGDFIPGDSDIDLGMWATDRRKAIRVLRQLGKFSLPNHGQPGTLVDRTVP